MKVDLKLFPYRPMFVRELSDGDLNVMHVEECSRNFGPCQKRGRVIFSNEFSSHIPKFSIAAYCVLVQAVLVQYPHCFEEVKHPPLYVLVWGAMNSEYLFKPYFFDGPVNHLNYFAMLENWFIPQLHSLGIESNPLFQEDKALAPFAVTVA